LKNIRVVLVCPEYDINVGSVCRCLANFGISSLYIVKPSCPLGFEAKKFAKHALPILAGAKICQSIEEACRGCSHIVGTTGVARRHKKTIRHITGLCEFAGKDFKGRVAILFGREGIGLTQQEIDMCSLLVKIETHHSYPIMNLSHAVAVVLYALSIKSMQKIKSPKHYHTPSATKKNLPSKAQLVSLVGFFSQITDSYSKSLRNPHKIKMAFKSMVASSGISKLEADSMLGIFRKAAKEITGNKLKNE